MELSFTTQPVPPYKPVELFVNSPFWQRQSEPRWPKLCCNHYGMDDLKRLSIQPRHLLLVSLTEWVTWDDGGRDLIGFEFSPIPSCCVELDAFIRAVWWLETERVTAAAYSNPRSARRRGAFIDQLSRRVPRPSPEDVAEVWDFIRASVEQQAAWKRRTEQDSREQLERVHQFIDRVQGEIRLPECFRTLGLDAAEVSLDDIDRAYRNAAFRAHPDHGGSAKRFRRIREAYEQCLKHARQPSPSRPLSPHRSRHAPP